MQKLRTVQRLKQGLNPQQIQFMNLLQLPSGDLHEKIRKEIEENPALEQEDADESIDNFDKEAKGEKRSGEGTTYLKEKKGDQTLHEWDIRVLTPSWREELEEQCRLLRLGKKEQKIVTYLIGALSPEGYLENSLELIIGELEILYDLEVTPKAVEEALQHIQQMDPAGVGARSLEESLRLQLVRKKSSPTIKAALEMIDRYFSLFSKRQYEQIREKMKLTEDFFQDVLAEVRHLKPQPITPSSPSSQMQRLEADFLIRKQGKSFAVEIPESSNKGLRVHQAYERLLKEYKKARDKQHQKAMTFIQKNIQRAKWFIQAVEQRHRTLLKIMKTLVEVQHAFFEEEDIKALRPLTLREIADQIGLDVSTISRAISQKSVRTSQNIYGLKFFFSEAIPTKSGAHVSSRAVKKALECLIGEEDKKKPYTDEAVVGLLEEQGFLLARRTVAKYREQLGILPSHFRRE